MKRRKFLQILGGHHLENACFYSIPIRDVHPRKKKVENAPFFREKKDGKKETVITFHGCRWGGGEQRAAAEPIFIRISLGQSERIDGAADKNSKHSCPSIFHSSPTPWSRLPDSPPPFIPGAKTESFS
ncbi:hypothetical protein TNCT_460401 [Trichonephila clavata]|uniref:Uncharacterized protein n=1 Tax=Trichonephila clavata TaxID=2740835 RepID=A0A8X6LNG3_TRICU|nr:hypothetical protein TNCT_460401 [Trichonephila clavata]